MIDDQDGKNVGGQPGQVEECDAGRAEETFWRLPNANASSFLPYGQVVTGQHGSRHGAQCLFSARESAPRSGSSCEDSLIEDVWHRADRRNGALLFTRHPADTDRRVLAGQWDRQSWWPSMAIKAGDGLLQESHNDAWSYCIERQ